MHTEQDTIKRVLIITHDAGNYGASRSLQLLVNNWNGVTIDLIVARRFVGRFSAQDIRRRFHANVDKIMKFHLPLDYCYRGKPEHPILLFLHQKVLRWLWKTERPRFQRLLRVGNYDLVHLNSLVLHQLIVPDTPCTIHVREIFDRSSDDAVRSLRKAQGIVFIDDATRAPFEQQPLPPSIVLNNPIDMSPLASSGGQLHGPHEVAPQVHTVFSMIGKITSDKGADFVVRCFRRITSDRARLLLVGGGDPVAVARAKQAAKGDTRIVFWGEEPDILKVYRISDYILRGEPYPCIGRTVYEGLYAGAEVVIPATAESMRGLFEYDRFVDRIHGYAPRDEDGLAGLLQTLATRKVMDRSFLSNADEYVRCFSAFVHSVLGNRDASQIRG